MASSDVTVDYGDVVVEIARTGSESSIVAGDGLVIAFRNEQLICLRFYFVGFLQELLSKEDVNMRLQS
jgi:hypothetical protein